MAGDAACLEEGLDFLRETDGMAGRGWQLRSLLGRDRGLGGAVRACPDRQSHVKEAESHSATKVMEAGEKDSANLLRCCEQSNSPALSSGSDREPSRFAARRNNPGCSTKQNVGKPSGLLRTGRVRGPLNSMQPCSSRISPSPFAIWR